MYDDDQMLMLSGIQHYMYCLRQWALIHVEQQWGENRWTSPPTWGRGLKLIIHLCQILRKELLGLRGFSATQLRDMRLFYEAWQLLDSNSSAVADEWRNEKN